MPKPTQLVRAYFKVVYVKTLQTAHTIRIYQKAIDSLEEFAKRPLSFRIISAELLKKWVRHLIETVDGDVGGKTAYAYRRRIVDIMKSAFPDVELVKEEPPVPGSLLAYFENYYRVQRMVGMKPHSIHCVQMTIRKFGRFLGRPATLADLNSQCVSEFLDSIISVEKLARATANGKRADLVALWNFAYRKHEVLEPPDLPKLREYRRLPKAWTIEELSRLLQTAAEGKGSKTGVVGRFPAGDWWLAFLLVCYDTGARVSSVRLLKYADIDFEGGQVTFQAETQKQGVEQRFKLDAQTLGVLQRLRLPYRQFLFEFPHNKRYLFVCLLRILKAAGLPYDRKRFFHCFRRTTASNIAAVAGIEAAAMHLGHSTADVTKRYVDSSIAPARDATQYLPRPTLTGIDAQPELDALQVQFVEC